MSELRLQAEGTAPASEHDWKQKLQEYAHQLTVLKVVTYVGGADIVTSADGTVSSVQLHPDGKPLLTVVDLVGGDLTNVIDPSLQSDTAMLAFHAEQVQKASAVLPNNIKLLSEFVKTIFSI